MHRLKQKPLSHGVQVAMDQRAEIAHDGRTINRAGWPAGPWDGEPDSLLWSEGEVRCAVYRTDMGSLCGYVGFPPGHGWEGVEGDDLDSLPAGEELPSHRGFTYNEWCDGRVCVPVERGVCPTCAGKRWVIGFDCAHSGDLIPRMARIFEHELKMAPPMLKDTDQYRTFPYARQLLVELAARANDPGYVWRVLHARAFGAER